MSLAIVGIIVSLVALLFTRVPYVNTPRGYIGKVFDNIDVAGKIVYDLGCGDGYFLKQCAQQGARRCVGYELSPMAYLSAVIKNLTNPVSIRFGNFFKADISQADIVYIYLVKNILADLFPKLQAEVKPGAIIITMGSSLADWKPEKIICLNETNNYSAYIYIK
jgi:ribosomal protein L11 methylase PrmA